MTRLSLCTWKTFMPSPRNAGCFRRSHMRSRVKRCWSDMCLSLPSRPSHQISSSGRPWPVRPVLVLEKLLAHENHRDPRRRQQKSRGHLGAAARVPGACIGWIRECGDARLTVATAMVEIEQVVVLDALKDGPARRFLVCQVKRIAQPVEIDAGVAAAGGRGDDITQGVAQRVAVADIEAHSVRRGGNAFPTFVSPSIRRSGRRPA